MQIVEAFADRDAAHYLIRDRDSRYSAEVRLRIKALGIQEILTAPKSPWQNPYAERLIGSIRRECLNHYIVLNAHHLKRTLSSYFGSVANSYARVRARCGRLSGSQPESTIHKADLACDVALR